MKIKRLFAYIVLAALALMPTHAKAAGGSSWVVIDAQNGRILNGVNEHQQLPIASLTKMWTALTFLENEPSQKKTVISREAASAEGSSIYLEPGSVVSTEVLLYGLMLRSGNDAAQALAEHAGGSTEGFVYLMNEAAKRYGLDRTRFTNPSGLHNDEHLSTAYDTAKMLYYAMQHPTFRKIATTTDYTFEDEKGRNGWENKHRLLKSEPSAIAGKTGFTKAAGRTLATYFERDGKSVIVVTLNNGDDWNVHKQLAHEVFSNYKQYTVAKKGVYQVFPHMKAKLSSPIQVLVTKDEQKRLSNVLQIPQNDQPKKEGFWSVYLDREPIMTVSVEVETERE